MIGQVATWRTVVPRARSILTHATWPASHTVGGDKMNEPAERECSRRMRETGIRRSRIGSVSRGDLRLREGRAAALLYASSPGSHARGPRQSTGTSSVTQTLPRGYRHLSRATGSYKKSMRRENGWP